MGIGDGLRGLPLAGLLLFAGIALTAATPAPPGSASPAVSEQTLYSFCSQANCTDGRQPNGGLIMDAAGNLYGTSSGGGNTCSSDAGDCGVVFKLASDPSGTGWTETVIYNFCSRTGCADGQFPLAGLVMDKAGNLYGTTAYGGNQNTGVAFQLTPNPNGTWTETVIYTFCQQTGCADGWRPEGPMIMDAAGNLYGTTLLGNAGHGTVFRLTPNLNTAWTETTLYAFCQQSGCYDGDKTNAGLIIDGAGNLYGTTYQGGLSTNPYKNGAGVVFELTPNTNQNSWTETVLYRFCPQGGYCADGVVPNGGLIMDGAGNLYGTAGGGSSGGQNGGVAFQLAPGQGGWTETVLYNFCSKANCADGLGPNGGLVIDPAGNLYGTAGDCVSCIYSDVVFELTPNQSKTAWTETVLYTFCSQGQPCTDGNSPNGWLLMDQAGNLYGTAYSGGFGTVCAGGCGVVFALNTGNFALTVSETGSGTVMSSPSGIDCPTTCTATFASGTQVTLTATPASGWTFSGWGSMSASILPPPCSGTGSCTLTIGPPNAPPNVFAMFTQNASQALSVSVIGSSGGAVTCAPAGIDCGSTCSASFAAGTQVTLTASPAKGWEFAGWGGACSGIGSCTVTPNASTSVSANFLALFGIGAPPVATSPSDAPALPPALIGPLPND